MIQVYGGKVMSKSVDCCPVEVAQYRKENFDKVSIWKVLIFQIDMCMEISSYNLQSRCNSGYPLLFPLDPNMNRYK